MELDHLWWLGNPNLSYTKELQKVLNITLEEAILFKGTTIASRHCLHLSQGHCSQGPPARPAIVWYNKAAADQNRTRHWPPIFGN
jgi:hypothetical protein